MQQHILLSIPILLLLSQANARRLEAVSIRLGNFDSSTNEWQKTLLSPVVWYDRIDEEESPDPKDRSFLTGRPGDAYDCSNNVVPPGAFLSAIGFDKRHINPELPDRLNRLEIHRVQDCEDDEPLEMFLELEGGWGAGETGPEEQHPSPHEQGQNFWVHYNNNPENTETEYNRDEMEEQNVHYQNDVIEEEQPLAQDDDDNDFQWIPREEAGFKKLRKRQAPPGSDDLEEENSEGFVGGLPATNIANQPQPQTFPGPNFDSPHPNANPNRRPVLENLEPLTPDSQSPLVADWENRFGNPNQQNPPVFRRLESDFEAGFGGGEGFAPGDPLYWDPMETPSEDGSEVIQFPQAAQRRENQALIPFPQNEAPIVNARPRVIPNLGIQDLLANARAAPPRDIEEWLRDNKDDSPELSIPEGIPPTSSNAKLLLAHIWPDYQLGPNTSFRFVFDPYVVHDVEAL
ncbi:hypothetical protein TWF970_007653 [Orbilia oligospora]|uniref:Uncharacterized protein n=1 Tax=Orbilia oligospora TaxID=2813651 RepID=A0A7C8RAA4_ORBOL|nr:hypothetical protein TWF970_007653 [Orbilia oligospora]